MNEQEPYSQYELHQAKLWWQRWTALKFLLLALRKLLLWILGLGIGLSALWDLVQKLTGGWSTPK